MTSIVGFREACEIATKDMEDNRKTVIFYKEKFYDVLVDQLSEYKLTGIMRVNGVLPRYHGKTLSLTFDEVDAESLVLLTDTKGVCIKHCKARDKSRFLYILISLSTFLLHKECFNISYRLKTGRFLNLRTVSAYEKKCGHVHNPIIIAYRSIINRHLNGRGKL